MKLPEGRGRRRQGPRLSPPSRPDSTVTKRRFAERDGGPAMKLFLSEDAVTARLQRLSLDNDHNYGNNGFPGTFPEKGALLCDAASSDRDSDDQTVLVDPGEFCMSGSSVLSVCPLLEESLRDPRPGNILPERLLQSLSTPCMDLVLWSPPDSDIQKLLRSLTGLPEPTQEKVPGRRLELADNMEM